MEGILVVFIPFLWKAAMKKEGVVSWAAKAAFVAITACAVAWCIGKVVFDYTQWFGN